MEQSDEYQFGVADRQAGKSWMMRLPFPVHVDRASGAAPDKEPRVWRMSPRRR